MSGVPTGGSTWKNIAIGIFTTVAAYAIIHFAGIGKKDNTKKIHKEATIKAWQSVSDYINYADQKIKTIFCYSCDEQQMKKEMLRELDNYSNKLVNIKEDKNVDNKLLSIVDIIIQRFKDMRTPYTEYFDGISTARNLNDNERIAENVKLQGKLTEGLVKIINRDSAEFKNFLKDVNTTFKTNLQQIPIKDAYNPDAIARKWNIECTVDVEFKNDGRLTWTEAGTEFSGTWKLKDSLLTIKLDNTQVLEYWVQQVNSRILIIQSDINGSPVLLGGCPK